MGITSWKSRSTAKELALTIRHTTAPPSSLVIKKKKEKSVKYVSHYKNLFLLSFPSDGELFVGTVADFSGMDPLIYREPLRTEQYDATNLNGMMGVPLLS